MAFMHPELKYEFNKLYEKQGKSAGRYCRGDEVMIRHQTSDFWLDPNGRRAPSCNQIRVDIHR